MLERGLSAGEGDGAEEVTLPGERLAVNGADVELLLEAPRELEGPGPEGELVHPVVDSRQLAFGEDLARLAIDLEHLPRRISCDRARDALHVCRPRHRADGRRTGARIVAVRHDEAVRRERDELLGDELEDVLVRTELGQARARRLTGTRAHRPGATRPLTNCKHHARRRGPTQAIPHASYRRGPVRSWVSAVRRSSSKPRTGPGGVRS